MWRLASSPDLPPALRDPWSPSHRFVRALEAHLVLDTLETMREVEREKIERETRKARGM